MLSGARFEEYVSPRYTTGRDRGPAGNLNTMGYEGFYIHLQETRMRHQNLPLAYTMDPAKSSSQDARGNMLLFFSSTSHQRNFGHTTEPLGLMDNLY